MPTITLLPHRDPRKTLGVMLTSVIDPKRGRRGQLQRAISRDIEKYFWRYPLLDHARAWKKKGSRVAAATYLIVTHPLMTERAGYMLELLEECVELFNLDCTESDRQVTLTMREWFLDTQGESCVSWILENGVTHTH